MTNFDNFTRDPQFAPFAADVTADPLRPSVRTGAPPPEGKARGLGEISNQCTKDELPKSRRKVDENQTKKSRFLSFQKVIFEV